MRNVGGLSLAYRGQKYVLKGRVVSVNLAETTGVGGRITMIPPQLNALTKKLILILFQQGQQIRK